MMRRYRRVFIASLITLVTSAILLGLIGFIRWRGRQAIQSDTHALLEQTSQQLIRSLQSRRGTLTLVRDAIERDPNLMLPQLEAIGVSAVEHTRHLIGVGLIRAKQPPSWWAGLQVLTRAELAKLNRALAQRTQLAGIWSQPSTFTVGTEGQHPLLIMMEPLNTDSYRHAAVVGVFELKSLLGDFFASNLTSQTLVRLFDQETLLYQSPGWHPFRVGERPPILVQQTVSLDAKRWTILMQPGTTRLVETLSGFNILIILLGVLAGFGVTAIVWLLTIRTWILQRAVERRTAALRRTTQRLRQMATTDELTGLHNRRFFLNRWEWEYERAKRYQRPLVCLMVDVNDFKQVNDRLGHAIGDLVLKDVAKALRRILRQSDILARFGGDEFIVALPETSLAQGELVAEKLRQVRINAPDSGRRGVLPVSLSVGISQLQFDQQDARAQDILEAADQSLYEWKRRRPTNVPSPSSRSSSAST